MRAQVRPQVRAVVRPQYGRGGVTIDPIRALFAHGESGAVLLPGTAYGICYVERTGASAATVATNGNPVGTYRCLVTGQYFVAPTDSARPFYVVSGGITYLDFDGIDDTLESAGNISLTPTWAAAAAVKFGTIAGTQSVIDIDRSPRYSQAIRQQAGVIQSIAFNAVASPFTDSFGAVGTSVTYVATVNRGAAAVEGWLGGVSNGPTATSGTPASGSDAIRYGAGVGARVAFLTGRIYGALFLGREWTSGERQRIETYLNTKAGN